ncbi:MAG: c-type cytochrome [Chloroflexi bacterium]|nr:c-type cytochrome [Chloroflexota bacterium]
MTLAEWLRFALLALLGGTMAWWLYRGQAPSRAWAFPVLAIGLLDVAQFMLSAQKATDPLTPLAAALPGLLSSGYGGLSVALFIACVALALWIAVEGRPTDEAMGSQRLAGAFMGTGVGLLVLGGAVTATANAAVSAFTLSGEVAMTPTLSIPRSALNTPNPYANDPQSAARGKVVYQQNCQVCHGIGGDGNGPAGANLKIRPPTFHNPQHYLAPGIDGGHFWVIQHGDGQPGGMPAWGDKLTPQQTWDAVDYIKTIAAGKPA